MRENKGTTYYQSLNWTSFPPLTVIPVDFRNKLHAKLMVPCSSMSDGIIEVL